MAILRAQVVLPFVSNKPEDVTVNTFHFISALSREAASPQIFNALNEFYNTNAPAVPPGTAPGTKIADYLSNALSRVALAAKIKVYDMADAKPRQGTVTDMSLFPSQFTDDKELPAEVACVGSYFAERNVPRRRGRVYIGPFMQAATADSASQRSAPADGLQKTIAGAVMRLITPSLATVPDIDFAVFSRVDGIARIATKGWCDNAWDTQRRRGQDATSRIVF